MQAEIKQRCPIPLFSVLLWNQVFQIRVIGNSFHLIFNYLQYVRLDTGVVAVYLLLHDVVTVCILELVDDRDFL